MTTIYTVVEIIDIGYTIVDSYYAKRAADARAFGENVEHYKKHPESRMENPYVVETHNIQ